MSDIRREARDIRRLRVLIPTFDCVPGCTDCCGPVPFSRWEWDQVKDKRVAVCIDCPYSAADNCAIYEDRPMMCRLFGAVDDPRLTCPHGAGPAVKLTAEQGSAIASAYAKLVGGKGFERGR